MTTSVEQMNHAILERSELLSVTVLVAVAGYGQHSDRQTSQNAGFKHHMVKPARIEQLHQILATVSDQIP